MIDSVFLAGLRMLLWMGFIKVCFRRCLSHVQVPSSSKAQGPLQEQKDKEHKDEAAQHLLCGHPRKTNHDWGFLNHPISQEVLPNKHQ